MAGQGTSGGEPHSPPGSSNVNDHEEEIVHIRATTHEPSPRDSAGADRRGEGQSVEGVAQDSAQPSSDQTAKLLFDLLNRVLQQQPREQPKEPRQPDCLNIIKAMKNMGTTKFAGGYNTFDADEWLQMIEKNFAVTKCPEDYKKAVAVFYLEKDASGWWMSVERQLGEVSWTVFRKEFENKYFPPEARDRLEREFRNLIQGSRTVREYESEFTKLRRYVFYGQDDEKAMIRNFMNGLRPGLGSKLAVGEYSSLNKLIEKAVNVETLDTANRTFKGDAGSSQAPKGKNVDHTQDNNRNKNRSYRGNQGSRGGQGSNQGNRGNNHEKGSGCYTCGKPGHFARDCLKGKERPVPDYIKCHACGEPGHYASTCPKRISTNTSRPPPVPSAVGPPAKKQATSGRVYALEVDNPRPSGPAKGPVAGKWVLELYSISYHSACSFLVGLIAD